jgi:hypothetical protein
VSQNTRKDGRKHKHKYHQWILLLRWERSTTRMKALNKGALGTIVIDPLGKSSNRTTGTAYYWAPKHDKRRKIGPSRTPKIQWVGCRRWTRKEKRGDSCCHNQRQTSSRDLRHWALFAVFRVQIQCILYKNCQELREIEAREVRMPSSLRRLLSSEKL